MSRLAITDAGAPFDNPAADVILRSADNVDFRIFKLLVSLASPFFKDMFALPQTLEGTNSNEMKDGLPVVQMAEEKKTLEVLLLMCYPMAAVDAPTLDDTHALLEAARKYNMEGAEKRVRRWLVGPRFLETEPIRVFVIACLFELPEEAKVAARATMTLSIIKGSYMPELEFLTAGKLFHLLQYHEKCIGAVKEVVTNLSWVYSTSYPWSQCTTCKLRVISCYDADSSDEEDSDTRMYGGGVLESSMKKVAGALSDQTWNETKKRSMMQAILAEVAKCKNCRLTMLADVQTFNAILAAKIEEAISTIELNLHL